MAETRAPFADPRHPCAEALLAAVPFPDPRRRSGAPASKPVGPGHCAACHLR